MFVIHQRFGHFKSGFLQSTTLIVFINILVLSCLNYLVPLFFLKLNVFSEIHVTYFSHRW